MKRTLRILDLFCGAGGCAVGYHRAFTAAGYDAEITGVDIAPQKHYPYHFIQGDAMTFPLDGYDFRHASPPCHDWTDLSSLAGVNYTGWMLDATYRRFLASPGAWVIENVSRAPMQHPVMLCGSMFGLNLIRHRKFDSSHLLYPLGNCQHKPGMIGVYGNHAHRIGVFSDKWKTYTSGRKRNEQPRRAEAKAAMGID